MKYLEVNTGKEITGLSKVKSIYETLQFESIYNKVEVENL